MPASTCDQRVVRSTELNLPPLAIAAGEFPFVSVIMPVRNEERHIERSLHAVLDQDYAAERLEILVADGESTDKTRAIVQGLQRKHSNLMLINNPGRIVPTGLNAAIRMARGEIIVRVDGHCEISRDYVSRCVEHLRSGEVDAVGGPVDTVGKTLISKCIAIALSSPFGVGGASFRTVKDRPMLIETVPFPAYTRAAIMRTGLFDEELVRGQDCEYNHRLVKLGGRILLSPDVRSKYYSRGTLGSLSRQYCRSGFWKCRVAQKHPRQMRWRQFVPALFLVVLACLSIVSPWSPTACMCLMLAMSAYLTCVTIGSALAARRHGLRYLPFLPVVFSTIHFSYALGFVTGFIYFVSQCRDNVGHVPAFNEAKDG